LLIGFWHDRPAAIAAAKKAFVMNALGDATMALALFLLIQRTGSLDFESVFAQAGSLGGWSANLVALGLLGGGVAKAAQLPSQTGYMFLGAGVGAYANGMFHLMTHAFFKALLFMAAGIVIHALAGEQDMRRMGGLRSFLPRTYWAFGIGALALAGVPPFSGFFSKDSILAAALANNGWYGDVLWAAGLAGAFLTGLYTFRMLFPVFWGEPSGFVREHFHALQR